MALNCTGPIAIGGCTAGVSIAKELGLTTTAQHSLNCTSYRTLSGQASGAVSMNAFHGKSAGPVTGSITYTPGSYTFTVPSGVTSISVVGVSGGGAGASAGVLSFTCPSCSCVTYCCHRGGLTGGGGGGLFYRNNISVTPGQTYCITVGAGGVASFPTSGSGGITRFSGHGNCSYSGGGGGGHVNTSISCGRSNPGANGTAYVSCGWTGNYGGGGGAVCYPSSSYSAAAGGAGAAGYSGSGGQGANNRSSGCAGTGCGGGGGGGGNAYAVCRGTHQYTGGAGGGVGVNGGSGNGSAGGTNQQGGGGGTGGTAGGNGTYRSAGPSGGTYGGGGAGGLLWSCGSYHTTAGGNGGAGVLRIIWPGTTRQFPSTNAGSP